MSKRSDNSDPLRLVSADELAGLWGVAASVVWREAKRYEDTAGREGLGPKVVMGHRTTRWRARDVESYLKKRQAS